ncbi:hypothetical protein QWY85_11970 [Neolewinella lacunae]|uniref:T9SS type A sorting domain-containing protein n=1 Tax=Neolewinella lacunae TaxID=1517758 RepID=A0A923PJ75_9BACT|nr:hypothetical protein [Neolewinella lacunae]MBC6995072.1 hypothetical protein [Neolewinella lacunae]MDN3635379.1 hypothetical protein [Neolewinella lacunae]
MRLSSTLFASFARRSTGMMFLLSTVFSLFAAGSLGAQTATITWNGSAGDGDWNNASNWNGGLVPDGDDIARFGFGTPVINIGPSVGPAQILLAGGAALTLNADVAVGNGVVDQHGVSFGNGSLTVGPAGSLSINAPGSKNGLNASGAAPAFTITNQGTITITGGNDAISIQNNTNPAIINNSGTITVDGLKGMFLGGAVEVNNSGHMNFQNLPSALTIGSGSNSAAVFNNLPLGVVSAFGNKMNVNGTFINDGLYRSDSDQLIFVSPTGVCVNNAFYDYTTGVRPFALGNFTDNGIQVNRNFAAIDMGGTCFADIGEVSYNYFQFTGQNGTNYGASDASGVLDLTANIGFIPIEFPKVWTEEMGDGGTYFVALDNYCGQLPIVLSSFTGRAGKGVIELAWTTAREENNDFIVVEKLRAGGLFSEVGRVSGAGSTTEARAYTLEDQQPLPGTNTYRLRQVDYDGTQNLSEVITVQYTGQGALSAWAYPTLLSAGEALTLVLDRENVSATPLDLITASGRVLASFNGQSGSLRLPATLLPGIYILRPRSGNLEPIRLQIH